jgi:hypothetical protein
VAEEPEFDDGGPDPYYTKEMLLAEFAAAVGDIEW